MNTYRLSPKKQLALLRLDTFVWHEIYVSKMVLNQTGCRCPGLKKNIKSFEKRKREDTKSNRIAGPRKTVEMIKYERS